MIVRDSDSKGGSGNGSRKVARFTRLLSLPSPKKEEAGPLFKPDRTYVITGGLGGLGMSLVEWMHSHGARHFCLLARRLPPSSSSRPQPPSELPDLNLKIVQCDVADLPSLDAAIATVDPPIVGIFHLAGALSDAAVLHQSWDTLHVTYSPKVYGTWNLYQVSIKRHLALDHFVLFSSLASLIGSGGQVNHASANAFMDAVAHFRVTKGLSAISINWGVWAQIGSAQGRKLIRGLRGFTPEAAYSVLELGLRSDRAQFGVSLFDWNVYDTRDSTWYAEAAAAGKKASRDAAAVSAGDQDLPEAKKGAGEAHQVGATGGAPTTLKDMQKAIVGVLRKLTGFSNIALDAPFRQLGVDSLMVIELRNRLQTLLKLTLPMTLMNEHPNVQALSSKLLALAPAQGEQPLVSTENSAPSSVPSRLESSATSTSPQSPPPQLNNINKQVNHVTTTTEAGFPDSKKGVVVVRELDRLKRADLNNSIGGGGKAKPAGGEQPQPAKRPIEKSDSNGLGLEDKIPRTLPRKPNSIEQRVEGSAASGSRPTTTWEPTDVAVIGMACNIGSADSPDEFWEMLVAGKHSVTRVPSNRRELASYFEETSTGNGTRPFGSFVNNHDHFDHEFFHITEREAKLMDPQQRLLLQLSWHALEDAGIPPEQLKGTKTGLFIGVSGHDYSHLLTRAGGSDDSPFLALLGNAHCIAAGRISQVLGLQGPSMAVDTACSSSLVALHLGVQALRTGQADTVIVGGSNLLLSHDKYVGYDRGGLLSSDGLTRSFDATAAGFVRGEGVAVAVLKRAADHDDSCLAIIKGTAVAHSGVGAGLGAPAGGAQVQLLQEALSDARTAASDVEYVEAQGAGSKLGDAVEVNALEAVFGGERERPLVLGTAKPNVGHLEACSGLAGLVKVIMSMEHRRIPPVLNLQTLNTDISNTQFFTIPRQATRWPSESPTMVAGLASMGYSGTNAFAIIHSGVTKHRSHDRSRMLPPPMLFPVSARMETALKALMLSYSEMLVVEATTGQPEDEDSTLLPCMAFSLTATRGHHSEFRHSILAGSRDELLQQLKFGASSSHSPVGCCPEATLFQIDGSFQLPPQLYETIPVFAKYRAQLSSSAASHGLRIQDLLEPPQARGILQEFSSQFILVAALLELGLVPEVMSGTGIGELVAAVHTGLIALDDSWRLVKAAAGLKKEVSFLRTDSNEWDGVGGPAIADRGREQNSAYGQIQFKPETPLPPVPMPASESTAPHSQAGLTGTIGKTRYWVEKCRSAGGKDRLGHGNRQPLTIFLSEDDEQAPPAPTPSANKLVIADWPTLISALGELYRKGMKLKLELLYDAAEYERLSLPPYPFQGTARWYK